MDWVETQADMLSDFLEVILLTCPVSQTLSAYSSDWRNFLVAANPQEVSRSQLPETTTHRRRTGTLARFLAHAYQPLNFGDIAMANCFADAPLNGVIHVLPGKLKLALVDDIGHIYFDTSAGANKLTDGAGKAIPFTVTTTALSFKTAAGNSYNLSVLHMRTPPGSRGYLVEDCDQQTKLGVLDDSNTVCQFIFAAF
jgi:hypothetical protein